MFKTYRKKQRLRMVNTVITNAGNETTPIGGYTWILVDGTPALVDTPPSWEFGSSNDFS